MLGVNLSDLTAHVNLLLMALAANFVCGSRFMALISLVRLCGGRAWALTFVMAICLCNAFLAKRGIKLPTRPRKADPFELAWLTISARLFLGTARLILCRTVDRVLLRAKSMLLKETTRLVRVGEGRVLVLLAMWLVGRWLLLLVVALVNRVGWLGRPR